MTVHLRWLVVLTIAVSTLVLLSRACAVPAGGLPVAKVYLPLAAQGAPRCNRWRGDDWWPCVEATLTAEARISSTPTATFRPWPSRTPTPMELEQPAETTPRAARPHLRRFPLVLVWRAGGLLARTGGPHTSVRLDGRAGHCAPMADGCYTAAHVLRGAGSVAIAGTPARWSVDAGGRDLAHVVAAAEPAVTLRAAVVGETLAWSNPRASGRWRVVAAGGGAITVCGASGYVLFGDSGTGGYAESDGALVGVLTNADLGQGWQASLACESGQEARLEAVP